MAHDILLWVHAEDKPQTAQDMDKVCGCETLYSHIYGCVEDNPFIGHFCKDTRSPDPSMFSSVVS